MWALSAVALAGAPAGVDLEDLDRWEDAAEHILDLPDGCWEWVGEASWDWDVGRFGSSRGDVAFAALTRDGEWSEVELKPLGEVVRERRSDVELLQYSQDPRFAPLVGRLKGARVTVAGAPVDAEETKLDENAESSNVLRRVLDRLSGDAYTSWAEWDEPRGGVVLHRSLPLAEGSKEEVAVQVFFPNGDATPSALDVAFPATFAAGRLPRWTIRDAEVHVRAAVSGGRVFPSSEAFKFGFGVLGFRFTGAQTVVYRRVTRCASDAPAPTPAPAPDEAAPPQVPEPTPEG